MLLLLRERLNYWLPARGRFISEIALPPFHGPLPLEAVIHSDARLVLRRRYPCSL